MLQSLQHANIDVPWWVVPSLKADDFTKICQAARIPSRNWGFKNNKKRLIYISRFFIGAECGGRRAP
jgi:hypothetical protein